jgi:uncharacterized protein (DUF433 family)
MIGRFIVADPEICHGKPTFRGTRILVADVLEQVASGVAWETIVAEWRGAVPAEAIAEAVRMASQALLDHAGQYVAAEYSLERVRA